MIMACSQHINHKKFKQMITACLQHINHKKKTVQVSNHGMFTEYKLLKREYGMIMACLQHINHKYGTNALWRE